MKHCHSTYVTVHAVRIYARIQMYLLTYLLTLLIVKPKWDAHLCYKRIESINGNTTTTELATHS